MTYAVAGALQKAVYTRLTADVALTALVGSAIYDAPKPAKGGDPASHVTIGEETARAASTKTSQGAVHDFNISVHSKGEGFAKAKAIAAAICDALIDAPMVLTRGHLVALRFIWARAERGDPEEARRIVLRFRAVIEDNS